LKYGLKARWMNFGVSYKTNPINVGIGMRHRKKDAVVYWPGTTVKGRIRIF